MSPLGRKLFQILRVRDANTSTQVRYGEKFQFANFRRSMQFEKTHISHYLSCYSQLFLIRSSKFRFLFAKFEMKIFALNRFED